ncbi:translation initiation factor IF-2 [bacterium]|nr:translation initiation factor IF-2 [bacterium]
MDKTEHTQIVEKRVKSNVIRRRKKELTPKEEELAAQAAQGAQVQESEKGVVRGPSPDERAAKQVDADSGSIDTTKDSPAKVVEQRGKAEAEGALKPIMIEKKIEEDLQSKFKKAVAKKKTRDEFLEEDIKRLGGLRQYAEALKDDLAAADRVYSPVHSFRRKRVKPKTGKRTVVTERRASKRVVKVDKAISIADLSKHMGVKGGEIIRQLMDLGIMATINQMLDIETATLIVNEYDFKIESVGFDEQEALGIKTDKETGKRIKLKGKHLSLRPPVVTVMGHVDHGKTSILDVIRKSDVVSGEAGGITQHIGAYEVHIPNGTITFIDTPGHAAFTAMRARGAQATDLVILVVAADDGVMPQTVEAIDHARAAGVPIIVAINKIDKPQANLDRVKKSLAEHNLIPEDWGGDTICINTSAKTKEGIDQLLEMVLLQSEMLELKGDPKSKVEGVVIEAKLDKGRGPVSTVLIKDGTLKLGDTVVCGLHTGNVRAMNDYLGKSIEEGGPSKPVEVIGLSGVPEAGDQLYVVTEDKLAKMVSEARQVQERKEKLGKFSRVSLEELHAQLLAGQVSELNLILKTDVSGSIEAIIGSLEKIQHKEVAVKVIHTGVGGITENDIMLASASNAVVIGFNVVADNSSMNLAKREKIEVKTYSIIYELINDVKQALEGLLVPEVIENVTGHAEVRDIFRIPKIGTIAGCYITDGSITRKSKVRLIRDNVKIYEGGLSSLKRFKDDAKEVKEGYECGLGIENYNDIKLADVIEAYEIEERARTLE